jgi:hypothetical protein
LEGGPGSDEDEEGEGGDATLPRKPVAHSYAAEQQELKQAFLQAAAEVEDGGAAAAAAEEAGGVLRKKAGKKRSAAEAGQEAGGPDKEQQVNQVREATGHQLGRWLQAVQAWRWLKNRAAAKAQQLANELCLQL